MSQASQLTERLLFVPRHGEPSHGGPQLTERLLAEESPGLAAAQLRASALALLVARETDSMRWSSLLSQGFLPPFDQMPRDRWSAEFTAYDELLVRLSAGAETDRARAELLHARVHARLHIDRRWDWLTPAERRRTLSILGELEELHGEQSIPGGAPGDTDSVRRRARRQRAELTHLAFGAQAPATFGIDLEGVPLDVAEFRGRIVVLDFWTSFCVPCLELVPDARRILDRLAGEAVEYIGVNGDPDRSRAAATALRVGMPWRNLWDGPLGTEGPAAQAWHVGEVGWPSVYVLDRSGRIRAKLRGKESVEKELEGILRGLLGEADAGG